MIQVVWVVVQHLVCMNVIKHVIQRAIKHVREPVVMVVKHHVLGAALVHVLVLLIASTTALLVTMLVLPHVRLDAKNLARTVVRLDVILLVKTTVHLVVKVVAEEDAQATVRMGVKAPVKVVVVVHVEEIVMALAQPLVLDADIHVWDVAEPCSSDYDYGKRTKRGLARRSGKVHNVYSDKGLSTGLQILLLGGEKHQGKNVLEYRQASYRLCA